MPLMADPPSPLCVIVAVAIGLGGGLQAAGAGATERGSNPASDSTAPIVDDGVIRYPVDFFGRYRPTTALDMVRQVPAFQIDDGESVRGFGGAAGNVLINQRRPGTKEDSASDILNRIPAAFVDRVELVRGQVDGINREGHAVVVNVVLHDHTPPSFRWDLLLRQNLDWGWTGEPRLSISHQWREIKYDFGIHGRRYRAGDLGTTRVFDGEDRLLEIQEDELDAQGWVAGATLNLSARLGDTLVSLNTLYSDGTVGRGTLTSFGTPQASGNAPYIAIVEDRPRTTRYEIGANAERFLQPDMLGKVIGIFRRQQRTPTSSRLVTDLEGNLGSLRQSNTDRTTTEAIGRAEFSWGGWTDHLIQMNVEAAYNSLDNVLLQRVDLGDGIGLQQQALPNANTRVEEIRGDVLIKDVWTLGRLDFQYGLGLELSRIKQSGDSNMQRSFSFLKPEMLISYSPSSNRQTRLRVVREVGQLNFGDFVTSTLFEDEALLEGNPDLSPESAWIAELSQEQRFADGSAVTLTVFHHWISDVEDLLALPNEVPGNIGSGRRFGAKAQATLSLDLVGLDDARLDVRARLQDSRVRDPVTGLRRTLSGSRGDSGAIPFRDEDNRYALSVEYRQDFQAARVAWGFGTVMRAKRTLFKLDELDVFDEGTQLNAFVETTRWLGIRARLEGENLLDFKRTRDRTVFAGSRGLSEIDMREERSRTRGVRIYLKLSGSF